jgi:hypothetical protein
LGKAEVVLNLWAGTGLAAHGKRSISTVLRPSEAP